MTISLNGWLVLDKPENMSSAHAVARVKRLLNVSKIGHAGTLDPLATGVLPLAIGKATKTISYMMAGEKEYLFDVTFGESRTTDDREGGVCAVSDKIPTREDLEKIIPTFLGKQEQMPPVYSALKIQGRRACDLVRRGEEVHLAPREIEIFDFKIVSQKDEKTFSFSVCCSKGTYVRSLARDLAHKIGSEGYVSSLRRTKCHSFSIDDAISLDFLEEKVHTQSCADLIRPVRTALTDILELALTENESRELSFGRTFTPSIPLEEGRMYQALYQGELIALVLYEKGIVSPYKVFI